MIRKSSCFANSRIAIRAGILAAIILLVCAGPGPVERAASAPDWLAAARQVDTGALSAGSPAVVIGEWTDFNVDATGKFVETERRALRILNLKLADRYLQAVGYENSDESVVSIQAWSISSSGRVLQTEKKSLATEASYANFELFSDARVRF
jgi:hypothetical protein